jgi:hypothetical protein
LAFAQISKTNQEIIPKTAWKTYSRLLSRRNGWKKKSMMDKRKFNRNIGHFLVCKDFKHVLLHLL